MRVYDAIWPFVVYAIVALAIFHWADMAIRAIRKRWFPQKHNPAPIPTFSTRKEVDDVREVFMDSAEVCNGIMVGAVIGDVHGVVVTLTKDQKPFATLIMPQKDADDIATVMMRQDVGSALTRSRN
jgi:hypothetical protein